MCLKIQECLVLLVCVIPPFNNGMPSSTGNTTAGQNITYTCSMGFVLIGSESIMCQTDGTFSPSPPRCDRGKSFSLSTCLNAQRNKF